MSNYHEKRKIPESRDKFGGVAVDDAKKLAEQYLTDPKRDAALRYMSVWSASIVAREMGAERAGIEQYIEQAKEDIARIALREWRPRQ